MSETVPQRYLDIRNEIAALDWEIYSTQDHIERITTEENHRPDKYERFYSEINEPYAQLLHEPLSRQELEAKLGKLLDRKVKLREDLSTEKEGDPTKFRELRISEHAKKR